MIILTEKELAKKLGVSYWTIRNWRLQLGLPHFRTTRRIFYNWESVIQWMSEQEHKTSGNDNSSSHRMLPIAQ